MNHDNSYHRADCLRNQPHNDAIKRSDKCTQCKATPGNGPCAKPDTFKQFLEAHFSKQFGEKYMAKRAAHDAKKKS